MIKKLLAVGFLLFLALWIAGFCRTYSLEASDLPSLTPDFQGFSVASGSEYRSGARHAHNLAQLEHGDSTLPKVLDQEDIGQITVFDKTAQLSSGTTSFTEDENQIRKAIAGNKAMVFSEKSSGIAPHRQLLLGISVPPDRFDALLKALMEVGHLESVDIQQQDRTAEFRKLHSQRLALTRHKEEILKVRENSKLSVEEALKLQQIIADIDKEIRNVGVKLGDLLAKEPSYNLFLQLQEGQPGSRHDREFTIGRRIGSGIIWAAGWWFLAAVGAGAIIGALASIHALRPSAAGAKGAAQPTRA